MAEDRVGVLFICLGNICRSPLAEAVFRAQVQEVGLADRFDIDSAGTGSYHEGEPPDERTLRVARARGIAMNHTARRIQSNDLRRFHYVLAMDAENLRRTRRLADGTQTNADIRLLRSFDPDAPPDAEVPDPYFGGGRGFETVHELVESACRGLLQHIRKERGI
jgi:protein-tyrosine phosphatase